MHIALSELRDFVEGVESKPFPHDVVEFPAPKPSCLQPAEQEPVTTDSTTQPELEGMVEPGLKKTFLSKMANLVGFIWLWFFVINH